MSKGLRVAREYDGPSGITSGVKYDKRSASERKNIRESPWAGMRSLIEVGKLRDFSNEKYAVLDN